MLERLTIRDLALVDHAEIELGAGLNVITGETGAGKSLVVGSMGLLVGQRADAKMVREGAKAASVEGEFRLGREIAARVGEILAEWGIEFDGEQLIVRREVQASGKSRAIVNQSAVTQKALERLGEILADLHGQHEHQSLLRADAAVDTLDRLAAALELRARYSQALEERTAAAAELESLEQMLRAHADRRDWMLDAARELDEARLAEGEEEGLKLDAARLAHSDRLRELVTTALDRLTEGEHAAADALAAAGHSIDQAAALDPSLAEFSPALEEARIAAGEAARGLAAYAGSLEADPQALESVEQRRETIAHITRKYRRAVPDLLAWREELRAEIATGEDAEGSLERARERLAETDAMARDAARTLSKQRHAAAREWSGTLTKELKPLGLAHAEIEFAVESARGEAAELGIHGLDRVELRFTANPGEPPRPLAKIASGGELSRVMLALKVALEAQDPVDVLVFDEVDSGIGGAVAQAVGERLRRLSRHRPIVCITHLPMIAALATRHLRVTKHVLGGRTVVRVESLEPAARVDEIARMLAGDRATATTRRQAIELLSTDSLKAAAR